MAAANNASFYHPEHALKRYIYGEGSAYRCAACELTVTGAGHRCGACDFNIHEDCLSGLPRHVSLDEHPGHRLALTRLRASRWCNACRETSAAGAYMYICAPCNYDVHPRCAAEQRRRRERRDRDMQKKIRAMQITYKVVKFASRVLGVALPDGPDPSFHHHHHFSGSDCSRN